MGASGIRAADADGLHGRLEFVTVFRTADCLRVSPDELHMVAFEDSAPPGLHGQVEGSLPSQGGQQRVGAFAADDFVEVFRSHRLEVCAVGKLGVGHHRGRIAVEKHQLVALLLQDLAGLHAGIVELATLANDDGARPQ